MRPGDLDEVDVGAIGKRGVMAKGRREALDRNLLEVSRHEDHEMRHADLDRDPGGRKPFAQDRNRLARQSKGR